MGGQLKKALCNEKVVFQIVGDIVKEGVFNTEISSAFRLKVTQAVNSSAYNVSSMSYLNDSTTSEEIDVSDYSEIAFSGIYDLYGYLKDSSHYSCQVGRGYVSIQIKITNTATNEVLTKTLDSYNCQGSYPRFSTVSYQERRNRAFNTTFDISSIEKIKITLVVTVAGDGGAWGWSPDNKISGAGGAICEATLNVKNIVLN